MKKIIVVFCLIMGLTGTALAQQEAGGVKDGLFMHISHGSDDPHRLLMALSMANMMADSHDVLVYFDIEGIEAVLKDSPDITFAHFPSLHKSLANLVSKNVTIMACPGCMKVEGKTKEDLAEGVQIANKETFFSFTKGRILSLDY